MNDETDFIELLFITLGLYGSALRVLEMTYLQSRSQVTFYKHLYLTWEQILWELYLNRWALNIIGSFYLFVISLVHIG